MLLNKSFRKICLGILFIAVNIGYVNAETPLFSCPNFFTMGDKLYPLSNASLFDGPVEEQVELVPEMAEHTRKWNIDPRMDPYLICRFDKINHTIIFHVTGAVQCTANEKPFTAQCN